MNRSGNRLWRATSRAGVATCLTAALVAVGALSATAAPASKPNSELGYPVFQGDADPIPASGVTYDPTTSYLGSVFAHDQAEGAGSDPQHDFWVDSLLARYGTAPNGQGTTTDGGTYSYDSDGNQYLFSRGRAAFLRTHDPKVLGFGGDLAYWDSINGKEGYSITLTIGGQPLTLTEDETKRKQTPSYWQSTFTTSQSGLTVVETKYITDANVLVTQLALSSDTAVDVGLSAESPLTSNIVGGELTGIFSAHNNVTTVRARFSGNDVQPQGTTLDGTLTVDAGQTVTTKLQLGLTTPEIPESTTDYEAIASGDLRDASASYTAHVTAYNKWWAENIPYIETPEHNIDKTFFYRWWLTRFNFLDANMPGNTLQFPTSIEGVLGYDNAIDLTIGMFIDDLKWLRDPAYSYGTWMSAGETAGAAGEYRDNPADPSNWNATHTQYITQAAWESYQVHGGPAPVAELLGQYGASDVKGQLAVNDSNGNDLLDTNWNAWTGNDADAVSFAERPGDRMDRAESAYVYAGAVASAAAYRLAGDEAKATEMDGYAARIKNAVLNTLWDKNDKLIEHTFANGPAAGQFAKWKEVNNYYPYAVGLMPAKGDSDYSDDYESALRLFADADQFPVFPFFTANQADKAASGGGGTNNFSVINSTVIFRIYQAALRQYHSAQNGYISNEQFKQLLYWNAFAHYQGGDNRYPDQNEFWADGSAANGGSIGYRSWIHHTQLGTTNWTMIEDVAGLRPREDAKVELDPIALPGWGHFTVNNLSYHGQDLSIVWNGDDTYTANGAPKGYSLYVDGKRAFTVDSLAHLVYDPATGDVSVQDGGTATVTGTAASTVPGATGVVYGSDSRITDLMAKAGRDIDPAADGATNLALGATVDASSQAADPARAATNAVDGSTVAQRFWAPSGSGEQWLSLDFGTPQTIDDLRLYFYQTTSSTTAQGFAEPALYRLEYWDGAVWKPIVGQARTPVIPQANYNRVQFPAITAQKVRAVFTGQPGSAVGVKEFQAYDTGIAAPASTNAAPSVIASEGSSRGGAVQVNGIVKDDGQPSGQLTTSWSMVSGPDGGEATFEDAATASTTVRFSTAGAYVLKLTASDGEREGSDTITVQGVAGDGTVNAAPDATVTASYTAGWNNINAVKDGEVGFNGGDNSTVWATWSGNRPAQQWLQYDWKAPIPLTGASMAFWHDTPGPNAGGGVAVPKQWKLQYWDDAAAGGAGGWADVTLADGSSFGTAADAVNDVRFAQVTTSKLRATFDADTDGSSYAAVGVSEFEALAPDPVVIDRVDVATTVGTLPALPGTVSVVYADGSRRDLPVTWPAVSASQVASESEFELSGTVTAASTPATAKVWVRSDLAPGSLTLNGTVPVTQALALGTPLQLPATVTGIYNNGINRSGLPVSWSATELAAVDVSTPGTYVVNGTATDTINPTQTAAAKATITVGKGAAQVDKSALQALVDANADRQQGSYTDESWKAFTDARSAAEGVLADATATQAAVDAALDALQTAIDGLIEKTPEVTVTGITVSKAPDKTDYRLGEQLDLTGLEVTATLSSGGTQVLGSDAYTVSGFDSSTAGSRTVTIALTANPALTGAFQVRVSDPSISTPGSPGSGGGNTGTGTGSSPGQAKGGLASTGTDAGGSILLAVLALITAAGGAALTIRSFRRRRA